MFEHFSLKKLNFPWMVFCQFNCNISFHLYCVHWKQFYGNLCVELWLWLWFILFFSLFLKLKWQCANCKISSIHLRMDGILFTSFFLSWNILFRSNILSLLFFSFNWIGKEINCQVAYGFCLMERMKKK